MKLFISFSGPRSNAVAEVLNEWLPTVINAVKPFYSPEIEKGTRWGSEISGQLQDTKFGLICLTPENLNAPWILFESGALSKTLEKTFVCTFLLGVDPVDLQMPLSQFQFTKFNKVDMKKLLETINKALEGDALDQKILDRQFEIWWPDLESKLTNISKIAENIKRPKREDREILEEILLILRSFASTNEHLVSKIQQAFPYLSQEELSQMLGTLVKWLADGIGPDNQPAIVTRNSDGKLSVSVLSIEKTDNRKSQNLSTRSKKRKGKSSKV
jgi:hypothetical protein